MRIWFFILISAHLSLAVSPCGFSRLHDHLHNALAARTVATTSTTCAAGDLYDNVQVFTTAHFRIYYTLSGPHAALGATPTQTKPPFIDSLAATLEKAWTLHTTTLGMRAPKPMLRTTHYRRSDFPTLYPVEVIELTLLRDTDQIMGGPCEGCYGLTYPGDPSDAEATELLIDNDFVYASSSDPTVQSIQGNCTYTLPETPLISNNVDYSQAWNKAIRVTAFHELYHATQLRYLDFREHESFWFEASAVGVEEMGAPEVNDYWQYLDAVFRQPGTPVTANRSLLPYGQATLYLFLHTALGPLFDASLWQGFNNNPSEEFPAQLAQVAQSLEMDAETLFHAYAISLFFSGHRERLHPGTPISADQAQWPSWSVHSTLAGDVASGAFDYIRQAPGTGALPQNAESRASLLLWDKDSLPARVYPLENQQQLALALADPSDSSLLVLSRLQGPTSTDSTSSVSAQAWPNPWNGTDPVCFGPLPTNSRGVEIRTADGLLLTRLARSGATTCWQGLIDDHRIAPGVLHWRVLPHGKTQVLLVIF